MHLLDIPVSPPIILQNGGNGGLILRTSGYGNSWARTTSTSIQYSSRRFFWVMAVRGPCCTICLPQVCANLAGFIVYVYLTRMFRISQLRRWQVFKESQSGCVWPCSQGDRYPCFRVEILLDLHKTGDRGCHVLLGGLCKSFFNITWFKIHNITCVQIAANNNVLLNK